MEKEMEKKVECVKNIVNEIEKCNAFVLEPHAGVFNKSDRFYEVIDMIWLATEKNIISKKLANELEDMLIVP